MPRAAAAAASKAKAKAKRKDTSEEADEVLVLSQQSGSSDDHGNMLAVVAQQMQVSWEKKKKDKEAKFLQVAKREVDKIVTQHADRFSNAVEEINTVYEQFVAEYAAAEDEIRALWTAIAKEQQAFIELAMEKKESGLHREKEREESQLDGMASCKRACEDLGSLITSLTGAL
ncbi:hypothetical protein GLOTRDRAFT_138576 [Gloeophyllum trabeum ATCC 11539]|uniref:Uncharacterized protein n=1 Tax=Gloeophyllum trabeum (strain ATCC 11539 / FP-39264 / Madison 617) TaxID=670483 RepID=S7RRZ2_GLOTA|nr:uncharacterized protein GLOTRDRAFT_138576 [Gloeophyllum trabeum ATCC 11539]EPQ55784.1 hypothetical protein GLOTRDRAFT_138576 [Gloeophyllum trabeum ATCC 11539]